MKSVLVILTLMGCDCDMQACRPIPAAGNAGWQSVEECEATLEALILEQGAGYPAVIGHCDRTGQVPAGGAELMANWE